MICKRINNDFDALVEVLHEGVKIDLSLYEITSVRLVSNQAYQVTDYEVRNGSLFLHVTPLIVPKLGRYKIVVTYRIADPTLADGYWNFEFDKYLVTIVGSSEEEDAGDVVITADAVIGMRGDKGDPFLYSDFTPEQLESLKVKGDPFTYEDFTPEQLEALKPEGANYKPTEEILWANLMALRDSNQLIPGTQYRITDYSTTTVQENTQSAGHQFDIIITADDVDKLNENARAVQRVGDTYFDSSKVEAWKLKYSLDNDTTRFAWADIVNGKGVVYEMIDENNNECPYDFKNIQFKRKLDSAGFYDPDGGTDTWVYTFTWVDENADIQDLSIVGQTLTNDEGKLKGIYSNKIKSCSSYGYIVSESMYALNDNVFIWSYSSAGGLFFGCYSNTFGSDCYSNTFGDYCYSNTFGDNCSSNTFGIYCYSNIFGDSCTSNTFGTYCNSNTFGNYCSSNTFGNECFYNTFGNECYYNTFEDECQFNTFGENCSSNTFGNGCNSNTFKDSCSSNAFGGYCESNTFGYRCESNTLGSNCFSNTFGTYCNSNTFGNECSSNTFGNKCQSNSFERNFSLNTFGNECYYNIIGNNCESNTFGNGCNSNTFENGCSYNTFGNNCSSNTFGNGCSYNTFGDSCYSNAFGGYCESNTFGSICYLNTLGHNCKSNTFGAYISANNIGNSLKNVIVKNGVSGVDSSNRKDWTAVTALYNKNYPIEVWGYRESISVATTNTYRYFNATGDEVKGTF